MSLCWKLSNDAFVCESIRTQANIEALVDTIMARHDPREVCWSKERAQLRPRLHHKVSQRIRHRCKKQEHQLAAILLERSGCQRT